MSHHARVPRLGLGENVRIIYIDDSKEEKRPDKFQVIGAVIINDAIFDGLEQHLAYYLYELVEPDVGKPFEECHACDLLAGNPPFENVKRQRAIEIFSHAIAAVNQMNIPVIYAAVDLVRLNTATYGSASAVDMAFRSCVQLIEQWFKEESPDSLGLLVSDNGDKGVKEAMLKSFHLFRNRAISSPLVRGVLEHLHDDMYFGDSKFSKGIQLADICTLIIRRHLAGYEDTEDLYQELSRSIVKHSMEPL